MRTKNAESSADPKLAQIDQMTTEELRALLQSSWDERAAGRITAKRADAVNRAARKRLKAIRQKLRS
jgi:hypothetical protein